ncbi:sodium:calcium antiporter [bacterium]|nr:MAG: sodium:calcium antiporter [bacterium]
MNQLQTSEILRLLAGVAGTWLGAELLVRGSVRLAISLGLRPLLVGLTVVAFGTSSPEAVVSFVAAARDSAGIAVGNVIGSNIANIGLILGLVSLVHPMRVQWPQIRRDALYMLAATVVAAIVIRYSLVSVWAGIVLVLILVASITMAVRSPGPQASEPEADTEDADEVGYDLRTAALATLQSVIGLVLLLLSARLLVLSAEVIARAFGIEEAVIGATVVAVGTSIPELAASLVAVMRGHYDIGIGNLVGSNLMNLSFVFGAICIFRPDTALPTDAGSILVPVMLAFTLAFLPMLATGGRVGRREGAILLVGYLAFSWYIYY